MTQQHLSAFAVLIAIAFTGCGASEPKISLASADQVQAEIERCSKGLDEVKASRFRSAVEVLAMHAVESATTEESQKLAPIATLNGKTPSEVIAAYEKLGPEIQLRFAEKIVRARMLKEANDYREKANIVEEQWMNESPQNVNRGDLLESITKLEDKYDVMRRSDGYHTAAKWVLDEYEKGPEYIINNHPGPTQMYRRSKAIKERELPGD